MLFEEAMKMMRNGPKVQRPGWGTTYLAIGTLPSQTDVTLMHGNPAGVSQVYLVTVADLMADDWAVFG